MMHHRVALGLLATLLILAAAPLAYAWAQLLPEERRPFEVQGQQSQVEAQHPGERKRDLFAIVLLIGVTLSYLLKFPGMPVEAGLHWMASVAPPTYFHWILSGGRWLFLVIPGIAAVYAAAQRTSFRISLGLGGLLTLLLWLANPYLRAAIQK